jgi:O-antigen/teichoic acid export membrane protein
VLLVPLLLRYWGDTKYGLYISVFAILLVLRTLDFGFQSFVGNEFNKLYHVSKQRAAEVLGAGMRMASLLGLLEVLILGALIWQGAFYKLVGIEADQSTGLVLGMLGMAVMWWLGGTVSGLLAKAVLSKGLYPATTLWGILYKGLEIVLLLYACFGRISLGVFLISWSMISLVYFGFTIRWAVGQLRDVRVSMLKGTWIEGIKMLVRSLILTVNSLLDQLSLNGVVLLVTNFLSLALVPVFSTIRTLTNTVVQLNGLIVNPIQPELIRYHSEKSGVKIKSVFVANWLISGCIVNLPLLLILPFVEWLYYVWTNGQLEFDFRLFYLLAAGVSMNTYGRVLITYLQGINDLKSIAVMSTVKFTVLFAVSLLFIRQGGLIAIGSGVILSELIGSVVLPSFFARDKLKELQITLSFSTLLLAIAPLVVVSTLLGVAYFNLAQLMVLSVAGVVCLIVLYSLQWRNLDEGVKARFISLGKRLLKRN